MHFFAHKKGARVRLRADFFAAPFSRKNKPTEMDLFLKMDFI